MGSLNLVALQFPGALMPYDFLNELRDIWDLGHVRPNAFILLRKDKNGAIAGMEGGRVMEEDDIAATNAVLAAIASRSVGRPEAARSKMETAIDAAAKGDFGLSLADIKRIAKKLPRDHSAIIILFENTWERRLKEVAAKLRRHHFPPAHDYVRRARCGRCQNRCRNKTHSRPPQEVGSVVCGRAEGHRNINEDVCDRGPRRPPPWGEPGSFKHQRVRRGGGPEAGTGSA